MFDVYDVSIQLIQGLRPLVAKLEARDRDLANQLRRAGSSIALNVAEGNRRAGKNKTHHFRIAAGSAAEVGAGLDVARAWGILETPEPVLALLDRVRAMLWKLTHP